MYVHDSVFVDVPVAQSTLILRSVKSPYTISLPMQIRLCTWRGFRRLAGDMANFYATVFGNFVMALVIGKDISYIVVVFLPYYDI